MMRDLKFKSLSAKKEGSKIVFEVEFENIDDFGENYAMKVAAKIIGSLAN